ncbi:MAG: hypothetical protein HC827_06245 [Cyanobacteria bacterium RM1_2_2]|nr:hypothetical protein [Cyanobacteria bacterium RM1_2_2]
MFREFVDSEVGQPSSVDDNLDWQYNRMILIGEPDWVRGMIYRLHAVGIAEVSTWSRIMPTGKPGEVISTLLRPRRSR